MLELIAAFGLGAISGGIVMVVAIRPESTREKVVTIVKHVYPGSKVKEPVYRPSQDKLLAMSAEGEQAFDEIDGSDYFN